MLRSVVHVLYWCILSLFLITFLTFPLYVSVGNHYGYTKGNIIFGSLWVILLIVECIVMFVLTGKMTKIKRGKSIRHTN
jgi:hypothetical protein